jgi:hypothetical protein
MNVYLSSRYGRRREMLQVATDLTKSGHQVVSTWIEHPNSMIKAQSSPHLAVKYLFETESCDVLVHYSEKSGTPGAECGWRMVELGAALITNKRVIIVGPIENTFSCHPLVERVGSTMAMLLLLEKVES